jgi:polyhydroxyalkanoate synthesis regulator phasin
MTANELADELVKSNFVSWGSCTHEQHDNDKYFKEQAATMLRQQQSKIESLQEHNANLIDDLFVERKEVINLETEIESLHKKIINLSFDLEYAKRTDEFVKKASEK